MFDDADEAGLRIVVGNGKGEVMVMAALSRKIAKPSSVELLGTIGLAARRAAQFVQELDLVELLCSIPNSPLFLTADLHVTPSPLALTSLPQFATNSSLIHLFSPSRIRIGVPQAYWLLNQIDFVTTCSRKRKLISFLDCELSPVPKRRVILNYTVGERRLGKVLDLVVAFIEGMEEGSDG
ncbi:hypothetical protein CMV_005792 [Castanea mollissima]|uniref:Uncharacterized protein n=1 Tax=Castanea mollissima TaxID=60419 RepID=A0A8J4RCY9_9ROSI|nr:hypothetical protein CMV_005792 [Castanea mollissima]